MIPAPLADSLIIPIIQVAIAIYLWLRKYPKRSAFGLRLLICALCIVLFVLVDVGLRAIGTPQARVNQGSPGQVVTFGLLFALSVIVGFSLYDISPRTSIFCCIAGYTMQNLASSAGTLVRDVALGSQSLDVIGGLAIPCAIVIVYAVCYLVFIRKSRPLGHAVDDNQLVLVLFCGVIPLVIGLDVLIKRLSTSVDATTAILLRICHMLVCVFVLTMEYEIEVNQRFKTEAAISRRLMEDRAAQLRFSQENIEAINIKCHDMRHQIRALAQAGGIVDRAVIDDMEREIRVYDSAVRTGNEALDTILTEKSLLCERHEITLTCIADGKALSFVSPVDTFSLFGNALDNAINATLQISDKDRRSISLNVQARQGLLAINIDNYFEGDIEFDHGLPRSSRGPQHGYGMRSMERIVEKYQGTLSARAQEGVFHLNMLMPIPNPKTSSSIGTSPQTGLSQQE